MFLVGSFACLGFSFVPHMYMPVELRPCPVLMQATRFVFVCRGDRRYISTAAAAAAAVPSPCTDTGTAIPPLPPSLPLQVLSSPTFRCFTSKDVIGVEVGGAVKNVIALAAGMCEGLGLGELRRAGRPAKYTVIFCCFFCICLHTKRVVRGLVWLHAELAVTDVS